MRRVYSTRPAKRIIFNARMWTAPCPPFNSHMVARHKANMYTGSPICFLLYLPATPFFTYASSIYQKRTASGQMLSPPYEVQIFCSRTGTPVWAAFTIQPGLVKMPTWTTPVLQSPPLPQKSRSPALACARGMRLPSLEAYCAWAVRAGRIRSTLALNFGTRGREDQGHARISFFSAW